MLIRVKGALEQKYGKILTKFVIMPDNPHATHIYKYGYCD